jgi:hypothetical protein
LMKQIVCDSFWACLQNCAKRPLAFVISSLYVCLSARNNVTLTEWIFVKFYICVFLKNSSRKFRFH